MEASFPKDEEARINALHSLEILDTPPEEKFDRITQIAQIIFGVPIALVSLVDTNRQWFKSCMGLSARETPRSMSFCAHAILDDDVLIIEDATKDERFADNPLVTGDPHIKFYAGKPIRGPNNQMLGTLCIIDRDPRKLSKADSKVLTDLGKWVESEFASIRLTAQLKKNTQKLLDVERELRQQNLNLENEIRVKTEQLILKEKMSTIGSMASRIAHDLKNPLSVIHMSSYLLKEQLEKNMDVKMKMQCNALQEATDDIDRIINDTLHFVKTSELNVSRTSVKQLLEKSIQNITIPETILVSLPNSGLEINCDAEKMSAVFSNIITNAVQAIEESGEINVKIKEDPYKIAIEIMDSGRGISESNLPKIFEPLFTTKLSGTGLGLNICKNIIEQHEGTISVQNNPTRFIIGFPKS